LLVVASVLGIVSITGLVLARPSTAKKPDAAKQGTGSAQITITAGKGRLGVSALQISPELRAHLGAPNDRGVLVDAVRADSPAAKAGVRVGDLVAEVDGDATQSAADIVEAMADRNKGETFSITLVRGGNRHDLAVTLEDDPVTTRVVSSGDFDQHVERMFRDMPTIGRWNSDDLERKLQDATRRIDELEKRLEKRAP
jgi:membrane-associated protease RseP (regulator of RpoE activity)